MTVMAVSCEICEVYKVRGVCEVEFEADGDEAKMS